MSNHEKDAKAILEILLELAPRDVIHIEAPLHRSLSPQMISAETPVVRFDLTNPISKGLYHQFKRETAQRVSDIASFLGTSGTAPINEQAHAVYINPDALKAYLEPETLSALQNQQRNAGGWGRGGSKSSAS